MVERRISLVSELLELQILDRDARPVGRVDDLELGQDGSNVVAILAGGQALANRFHGVVHRSWVGAYARLHDERRETAIRVRIQDVIRVDSRVDLGVTRDDLSVGRLDEWLNEHVLERIPGSGHAPE